MKIRWTMPWISLALGAASGVVACTAGNGLTGSSQSKESGANEDQSTDTGTDPASPKPGDETGTDEPIWMNASYLTCAWEEVFELDTVSVRCGVRNDTGIPNEAANDVKISAVVKEKDGQIVDMTGEAASDSLVDQLFTAKPWDLIGRVVHMTMQVGAATKTFEYSWDTLQGMEADGALRKCLGPKPPLVKPCFDSAGIAIASASKVSEPSGGTDDSTPDGPCSGKKIGEHCWYLSSPGQSCGDLCGGGNEDLAGTRDYAGSAGTSTQCEHVLDALQAPASGTETLDMQCLSGFGCSYELGNQAGGRRRCTTPATTTGVGNALVRRACACIK